MWKEIKILKHQTEVETFFPDLALQLRCGVCGVKDHIAIDRDGAAVRGLQKVQAPQKGGFAGAGGTDDSQGLALLQREADVLQHTGGPKVLFDIMYFQNRHAAVPLT